MPLDITSYVDPGVYQQEVNVPSAGAATSTNLYLGLIGVGNRNKRSTDEQLLRGQISDEILTISGTPSRATLINRSIRKQSQSALYKDSVLQSQATWSFVPAYITTDGYSPFTCTTTNVLVMSLDGKPPISMELAVNGTPGALAVSVAAKDNTENGFVATITDNVGSNPPALSALLATEIVAAINATLLYADDTKLGTGYGYGVAYATAATVTTATHDYVTVTSPLSTSSSDVAIHPYIVTASDAGIGGALAVTGTTVVVTTDGSSRHAKTLIEVDDYSATSDYTFNYVAYDTTTDAVTYEDLQEAIRVGNYAGMTSYTYGIDYAVTSATVSTINWSGTGTAWVTASLTGLAQTYDLSSVTKLAMSIDGKSTITIDLSGTTPAPGGAAPASMAAVTANEVVALINSTLAASLDYGAKYRSVASTVSSAVKLTSPTLGSAGLIEISLASPSSSDASEVIFDLVSTQLPYDVRGVGSAPVFGNTYFATYEYIRPDSDYNTPRLFNSLDLARADLGYESADNPLMVASYLAFKNKAPSIYVVQVDDSTQTGRPTQLQLEAALDAAGNSSNITDIVMLDPRSSIRPSIVQHIIDQNSPTVDHARRAWIGAPQGTVSGDSDTVDSFIYIATQELQVPADSPARGRLFLVAPSQSYTTITLEDGTEQTMYVDGTMIAVGIAALYTSRTSPAAVLLGTQLLGYDYSTFTTFLSQERKLMSSNGVCVVTAENNKLAMKDPLSTEAGGGKLPQFEEPSASSQKDNLAKKIKSAMESNVQGIVPTDLADFILSIKSVIGETIKAAITAGEIGPYRDDNGRTREISYLTDIQVFQSRTDARNYSFRYFFMLRYPAKRFFGNYSVDVPFFSGTQTSLIG
jgi:hypothetical protein